MKYEQEGYRSSCIVVKKGRERDTMIELFKDKKLDEINIFQLAHEINNSKNSIIKLPSFQRDAVWEEKKIELLWDSILRGFPIGTLLLCKANEYSNSNLKVKNLQSSLREKAHDLIEMSKDDLLIIDGQQRAISIALGFRKYQPGDSAVLWIDLVPSNDSDISTEKMLYQFYICSVLKPWGKGIKYHDKMEINALKALGIETRQDLLSKNNVLKNTYPLKATLPLPFNELISIIQGKKQIYEIEFNHPHLKKLYKEKVEEIVNFISRIKPVINSVLKYSIPVYLIHKLKNIDDLNTAFNRLNTEGLKMPPDELFFSGLKLIWPDAHNLIWEIYSDPQTGKIISPIEIVHLIARLAYNKTKDKLNYGAYDLIKLNSDVFSKLIGFENNSKNEFLDCIQSYLLKEKAISRIHKILIKAKNTLAFNPNIEDDIGLPLPMIPKIRWRVWHTICAWIDTNENVDAYSREEIIRYALFDHLYLKSQSDEIIREPFSIAIKTKGTFPGKTIYEYFNNSERTEIVKILTIDEYQNNIWDNEKEIAKDNIWPNEIDIVFWIQRKFIHKWYPDYDPSQFLSKREDLPYDIDHIIPSFLFEMRGVVPNGQWVNYPQIFWDNKGIVSNTIGNLRFWPKELNRADQEKSLHDKYLLGDPETITKGYNHRKDLALYTVKDIQEATFFPNPSTWEQVPYDKYKWQDENNFKYFMKAVYERRLAMYTVFFQSINWNKWLC